MQQNHYHVLKEIDKLRNPSKKHYTRITSLPTEVVGYIMSWIHPQEAWRFRAISKSFNSLLSSSGFIVQNLKRSAQRIYMDSDKSYIDETSVNDWDVLFFNAPALYQSEYVRRFMSHVVEISWNYPLGCALPRIWLSNLNKLVVLELPQCNLVGSIPEEIGLLSNLQNLDLYANSLTGEIPSSIGNLVNLRLLVLCENEELGGMLPSTMGCLTSLVTFRANTTNIMGPIPVEFGNLKRLETLSLSLNENPAMPNHIPPELGTLSRLKKLHLCGCHLIGRIPPELGHLASLTSVLLADNQLEGPVPSEWGQMNLRGCDLRDNLNLSYPFQIPDLWLT
ncbi:L domain-like protein [Rhizoclosmatium globosum]|uniref:L domain-like protein n=1 Tax=Rhizoclosmatium globosum TaxID=329046 RepID=A0A1Y2D0T2_9FUNG|nr:L domain-like protein [Rhizoclosmatium globosum]|eukprot:ORY52888.1 L domain-like protein [Rhizoclosmatium globosum]